jgi:4-amino-4-deoxy-L-arabinose transferase-like glycosyltransferase
MDTRSTVSSWFRRTGWVLLLIAGVQFALHLWVNAHDSIFRDELYYLAAAEHLDFGYVDFPPFVALVAGFSRLVFGDSVFAIRLLPALSGVVVVLLTASMTAMLGGGLAAQAVAALVIALGPLFIGSSGLMTMDPFDQMWWTVGAWVLVRMIKQQRPQFWLLFGLAAGLGLLNKLTMGFFVIAVLIGLLLSESRRLLFNRWLLLGGVIAAVIIAPYIFWQLDHGFPVLEFTGAYASGKTYQASPIEFLTQQLMAMHPTAVPLWLCGLYFLLMRREGRPYQTFGWSYVILFLFFMAQHAKFYWLSSAYPAVFAAGAYALHLRLQDRPRLNWIQPAYTAAVIIGMLLTVPMAIPILPAEAFIKYNGFLGGVADVKQENVVTAELPQNYADRYGWFEMASAVKRAYEALSPEEQAKACIYTANYGEAAAMDYFGADLGLPTAVSGHNSYHIWGTQGCTGEVLITVGSDREDLIEYFESVDPGPAWSCRYCLPGENGRPILIARGMKMPLAEVWPVTKWYY